MHVNEPCCGVPVKSRSGRFSGGVGGNRPKRSKWQARWRFPYGARSPVDDKRYNEKTVEVIFAEEPDEIVVVTVKVYYSGLEEQDEDRV
jgi:hypothetical protein